MAVTVLSPAGDARALDDYISSHAAKDAGEAHGFGTRVEYVSTRGNTSPETFVADVIRNQQAHGKSDLKHTTWHMVISWSNEEAAIDDEVAGAECHRVSMAIAERAFPGRMVKGVTQRDNGRWEGEGADRQWVPGKWHTHVQIAHVSERSAEVSFAGKGGVVRTRRYRAGRAVDGSMRNIARVRAITDEVVLEKLGYDNRAYVRACRPTAEVTREDVSQRVRVGYSTHDQIRERLDAAVAGSRDWDEYVAHAATDDIEVKTHGKSGASYAWRDDEGTEHKARARKLGNAYTRAGVEERQLGHGGHAGVTASARTKPIDDAAAVRHPEYAGATFEDAMRERLDALVDDPAVSSRVDLAVGMAERGVALGGDEAAVMTPQGRVACAPEHLGGEYTLVRVMGRSEREKEKERINDNRSADRGDARRGSEGSTAARRAAQSAQRLRALEHIERLQRDERSASTDRGPGRDRGSTARDVGADGRGAGAGARGGQERPSPERETGRSVPGGKGLVSSLERAAVRRRAEPGRGRDGDHGYGD
ncbi:hypothetical protein [Tsukamurella spumae]|uniref:Relaxase n=1 Tax=Tsukamurella spumae TaxID=44753 RepID=A0A846X5T7_9ACTN|nr:hypothetical protein [Tsukamurella spumae]NKY20868.1 hypothetical protein [Tsukamurella spumae]